MNAGITNAKSFGFPFFTWIGIGVLLTGQILLAAEVQLIARWITPVMWSGFILMSDGILYRVKGESWLTNRLREFPFLFLISIAVWILFEIYNFRLQNWLYAGLPTSPFLRDLAYFWSFGTIMPAVFISSEIIQVLFNKANIIRDRAGVPTGPSWLWFVIGIIALTIPLALPDPLPRYFFGLVWLGFIFLIDPINQQIGNYTFRGEWQEGRFRRTAALLLGGLLCGFLWEFWNYQGFIRAGGHWVYTIPAELRFFNIHFGQMPLLGLLGFPPFAIELYVLYLFIRKMLEVDRRLDRVSFFERRPRTDR